MYVILCRSKAKDAPFGIPPNLPPLVSLDQARECASTEAKRNIGYEYFVGRMEFSFSGQVEVREKSL